jgi:hypothetical protein
MRQIYQYQYIVSVSEGEFVIRLPELSLVFVHKQWARAKE